MKSTNMLNLMTKNTYGQVINHSKKYVQKPFSVSLEEGQTYDELFKGVSAEKYMSEKNNPAVVLSSGKALSWEHVEKIITVNGIKFFQLKNDSQTRQFYIDYLKLAKSSSKHGEYVLLRNPEEYIGAQLFVGENGCGGTVVEKDGHIVSLSKNKEVCDKMNYKEIGEIITLISIAKGGNKIECWKGFLTEFYIKRFGFVPITSIPFSKDPYAGEIEWNYERDGTPDVVFIAHNGDSLNKIIKNNGMYPGISAYNIKHAESYDKANEILNKTVDNKRVNKYENKKLSSKKEFAFI